MVYIWGSITNRKFNQCGNLYNFVKNKKYFDVEFKIFDTDFVEHVFPNPRKTAVLRPLFVLNAISSQQYRIRRENKIASNTIS